MADAIKVSMVSLGTESRPEYTIVSGSMRQIFQDPLQDEQDGWGRTYSQNASQYSA